MSSTISHPTVRCRVPILFVSWQHLAQLATALLKHFLLCARMPPYPASVATPPPVLLAYQPLAIEGCLGLSPAPTPCLPCSLPDLIQLCGFRSILG
jgi:hypothetical protein